jgi:hypothetical protein
MAACSILDFGVMAQPRNRADKTTEPDPQEAEVMSGHVLRQTAEPEGSTRTTLLQGVEQGGRTTPLPLSVSIIENQIESMPTSEDIEVRPTTYAHMEAKRVIVGTYAAMFSGRPRVGHKPPNPIVGTDDVGGILVSWASGNKYVAAKFASRPELRSFVYFEQAAAHQAMDLSEQNLLDRLRWLNEQ